MRQWTYQRGYPLLTATVDPQRRVWLQQASFGLQGAAPCDTSAAFWVPVRWAGRGCLHACMLACLVIPLLNYSKKPWCCLPLPPAAVL